jgi:2-C-methyl-D-erythritol 2,4-cyclodiphosphate synthase
VADALLGALALGDLGSWFGVDDPDVAGADSMGLLGAVVERLLSDGWDVGNLDLTVVAQRPRLAAFRDAMRERLADVLQVPIDVVSVKFTTTDRLGTLGRGEGIAAWATVLVDRDDWVTRARARGLWTAVPGPRDPGVRSVARPTRGATMAVDEDRRSRSYERLAEAIGRDEAVTIFELLPPPRTELATRADLDRAFEGPAFDASTSASTRRPAVRRRGSAVRRRGPPRRRGAGSTASTTPAGPAWRGGGRDRRPDASARARGADRDGQHRGLSAVLASSERGRSSARLASPQRTWRPRHYPRRSSPPVRRYP